MEIQWSNTTARCVAAVVITMILAGCAFNLGLAWVVRNAGVCPHCGRPAVEHKAAPAGKE